MADRDDRDRTGDEPVVGDHPVARTEPESSAEHDAPRDHDPQDAAGRHDADRGSAADTSDDATGTRGTTEDDTSEDDTAEDDTDGDVTTDDLAAGDVTAAEPATDDGAPATAEGAPATADDAPATAEDATDDATDDEATEAPESDADGVVVTPVRPGRGPTRADRERSRIGSVGRFAARGLAGLVGLALAATTVWAVTAFPLPTRAVNPPVELLTPVPGDHQRVCPGPLAVLGLDSNAPTDAGLTGTAAVQVADDTGAVEVEGISHVGTTGVAAPTTTSAAGPADVTAPGTLDGEPTALSVAQTVTLTGAGRAGFAATACTSPSADQWVVGGATTTGRSALLSIVNPSDATAIVRADVHTESGLATTPSLVDLEVPAGTQRVVSLEGVVPDSPGFAVHVTASGAPVSATVHEVAAQGLTPLGIDLIGATAPPATHLDVVGVPFTSTASESEDSLFTDRGAIFRALVTGDEPADVTVTVRELDGTALDPITTTLQPGAVTDIPLSSFPVGRYTVTLESSAPVVGAVRSSTAGTQVDTAWYTPSPTLDGAQLVAVPTGPTPRLAVANPTTAAVEIRVRIAGGDERTIEIAPGATWQSDVPAESVVELDGLDGAVASVTYDGPGQLAGMPVLPGNPLAQDLRVYR